MRVYAPTAAHARALVAAAAGELGERVRVEAAASAREAVERRRRRRHGDQLARAGARARVAGAGRARQRGRREQADGARDRRRDGRGRGAVLRQPRVGAQRGGRVPARARARARSRRGPRPRPSSARCSSAARARSHGTRRADRCSARSGSRSRTWRRPSCAVRERARDAGAGSARSSCERPRRVEPRSRRRASGSPTSRSARRWSGCASTARRREIYLKLETLQPINSFKIRGAANASARAAPRLARAGLVTASAGNMAQGVAWIARELGLAGDDRRPRARAGRPSSPRSSASAAWSCKVPYDGLVAGDRHEPGRRRRRACSCTRSPTRG